jgi:hypothetical protein
VPIETLFDHFRSLCLFGWGLEDFPTVSKEQSTTALEVATKLPTANHIVKLYETAA